MGTIRLLIFLVCTACMVSGCDPLTVHKVTSTIFDGVPDLPPADQYCQDFYQNKLKEDQEAATKMSAANSRQQSSIHPPYAEKRCEGCHDKSTASGLIKPRNEICFVCHPTIIKSTFVHGPASVGSCMECHDPHSSPYPSLLKTDKALICATCHREKRAALALHTRVAARGLLCTDCHNPHAGTIQYFLR